MLPPPRRAGIPTLYTYTYTVSIKSACYTEGRFGVDIYLFLRVSRANLILYNNQQNKMEFPDLSFSALNCNSLNMTNSMRKIQKLKLYGVTKLKTDVIFLSDTRISNRSNVSDIKKFKIRC